MQRVVTIALAGLDALALVALGLGLPLLASVAVWGFGYGFAPDFAEFYRASALLWLLGHGVDVTFSLDPVLGAQLGLSGAGEPFRVSAAIGGFAVLSFLLAVRAGRRAMLSFAPIAGFVSIIVVTAALAAGIVLSAAAPGALPSRPQGVLLPSLIVGLGALVGAELEARALGRPGWLAALAERSGWLERSSALLRRDLAGALRGGLALAVGTIGLAAAGMAVLLVLNYASVIGLYQGLQGGLLGATLLTVGQLLLWPNLLLLGASWLLGPGFALGAGSSVSPAGNLLGPVPALPVFGALPAGGDWTLAVLVLPALLSFGLAMLLRQRHDRYSSSAKAGVILRVAFVMALSAAGLLALAAAFLGGAIGPGALSSFGPDPLAVLGWGGALYFTGAVLGGFAGRIARRD